MKKLFKLGLLFIGFAGFAGLQMVESKILVFSNEQAQTADSGEFVIDVQNYEDDIDLKFGESIDARIRFNRVADKFEINRNIDLSGNQLENFKLESLAAAPVCDADSIGRIYYNTVAQTTHVCDGNTFNQLENVLGNDTVEFPALQIRRAAAYTLQTTFEDVDLDTTDLENESHVLEHDPSNADRILVKENGMYQVIYGYSAGGTATSTHEARARVRANDTLVLPGSESVNKNYQGEFSTTSASFLANLTAGDFISLQLQRDATPDTTQGDVYFSIIKLEGVKGEKGEAGDSGANNVQITQVGHGFTLTNGIPKPAYIDLGGQVALAQANSADTLTAFYVTEIIDTDNFMVQLDGILEVSGHGLNIGEYYFLDDGRLEIW